MDVNAYHLQAAAHAAVGRAIAAGKLVRQPCETCGKTAQAHHDSYYPVRWLDVRWLCPKHHKEWHALHEPEWPTIFEFHPSDRRFSPLDPGSTGGVKPGRPPHPWFRKYNHTWYVWHNGRQANLGRDREKAFEKFFVLRNAA